MNRHFITEEDLLLDGYRLGVAIYNSGFFPSFIVGLWRGGSSVGIVVQECLQYLGVEADHIEDRPKSQRFQRKLRRRVEARGRAVGIEEELHGIVARLAMDIDGVRQIRRGLPIHPVVVGEPAIGLCDGDKLSRPWVIEPVGLFARRVQDQVHAVQLPQGRRDLRCVGGVLDVDMRHLMAACRKRAARTWFEQLAVLRLLHSHQTRLPEDTVR